ncbi:MAG: hypothetical protein ABIJ48_08470 [Actinomycetota bacterium]
MTDRPRSDRFGTLVAVLGGLFVALATVLVVLLVSGDGGGTTTTTASGTTGADTTAPPPSTTQATTTSTTAASSTTAETTTTAPPFAGDLFDKTGPVQGSPLGRLADIRSADHPGYSRVVFDFPAGGIPTYWIGYTDGTPTHLTVILYPMDWADPYDPGIFDGGGNHAIGVGSILSVRDAGMGGGSGEWVFEIVVTSQKPFLVGTLDGPPRIYVDVGD